MDWVKLTTDYYRDLAIALGSDAQEVMFTRGCALAGEIEQHGFIPDAMLASLTRRPAQAKRLAGDLVKDDLWEKVKGGYQIVNWAEIQAELERLVARKKQDRDRKRLARLAARSAAEGGSVSADVSMDGSADSPETRPRDSLLDHESKTAAAATGARARTIIDLPPAVEILRSNLETHKLNVRWDKLTDVELGEIEQFVEIHGDVELVKSALRSFQPASPPVYASAWLNLWRGLRAPGDLAAVPAGDRCELPGHTGTTRHCNQCASEQKAAR